MGAAAGDGRAVGAAGRVDAPAGGDAVEGRRALERPVGGLGARQ